MKTQIVTEVVSINSINEIKHFEIRIPENTNQLTGIECSVRIEDAVVVNPSLQYDTNFTTQFKIADIRLQGAKQQTWFYADSIKDSLKPIDNLDFFTENMDMNLPFEYQAKHEKEVLTILPTSTRIKGFIKDVIGATLNQAIQYSITICLHVELND